MKLVSLAAIVTLGLTACTEYQPLQANCFDADTVTRATTTLNFIPTTGGRISTSTAPVSGCSFVALGEPADATGP